MAAIKFAIRGNSLNARYSSSGKTPGTYYDNGGTPPVVVNTHLSGMIGNSYIDMYNPSNLPRHILIYPGFNNLWSGQPFSILMRFCFQSVSTANVALWSISTPTGEAQGQVRCLWNRDAATLQFDVNNNYGAGFSSGTFSFSPTVGRFYDLVLTCTGVAGSTASNGWLDGVFKNAMAGSPSMPTVYATPQNSITLSCVNGSTTGEIFMEEFVVWDYVIDPTAVLLESGTGSLSGNTRTSFVAVAAFDGLATVDPGASNVKIGTAYEINGVNETGTYTGSDRWSDPGVANVRSGTTYEANAVAVTGTLVVPTASQVESGIAFDNGTLGTFKGAGFNTDPGVGNVSAGTNYEILGAALTGTKQTVVNEITQATLSTQPNPCGAAQIIGFSQGDDQIVLNLVAQDGQGNPVDIAGATFETQILGFSRTVVVVPNGQHAIVDATTGKFQVTLTAAETAACSNGQGKDITTKIVIAGQTIYYHGFGILTVNAEAPQN
jgi:hypothetical protein